MDKKSTQPVQPIDSGVYQEISTGMWGMVIDQDLCTGCQACVAACAMENNLSFVGEEDLAYGAFHALDPHRAFLERGFPRSRD